MAFMSAMVKGDRGGVAATFNEIIHQLRPSGAMSDFLAA